MQGENLKEKYVSLGNYIINKILLNNYKNVGVFSALPDNLNNVGWIKSMFHGCMINDVCIWTALDCEGKSLNDLSQCDMGIIINQQFNCRNFDIMFEDKNSSDFGIKNNVPLVQIDYCFAKDHFIPEEYDILISDGISDAKDKKSIEKYKKHYWELDKQEEKNLF